MAYGASSRSLPIAGAQSPIEFPTPYFGPEFHWNDDFVGNNTGMGSATADAAVYRIGGTGTNVITAHEDVAGSGGKFSTGASSGDEFAYQLNGSGVLCRARTAARKAPQVHFRARFLQSSITAATSYFGLWVKEAATTAVLTPATGTQPIGIGFTITDGVMQYISKPHSGSAVTATALGTFGSISTATFYNLDLFMDGDNNFIFLVNGKEQLRLNSAATPLSTTVGLSPLFGIKTTAAGAKYIVMQRLYCSVEGPAAGL